MWKIKIYLYEHKNNEKKSNQQLIHETIDQVATKAKQKGLSKLYTEDEFINGNTVTVQGQELKNFFSCSYLGLELDQRLTDGTIEAVKKWGTQFSSSREYVSVTPFRELEELMSEIFNGHVVLMPTTSLGHISSLPLLITEEDAVILDHQVHASVSSAAETLKANGIKVEMLRHNRTDKLEERIQHLSNSYRNVWYLADGVYSMYGDFAPLQDLVQLLNKYECFHLYVDDAHGMSWAGKNGKGYTLSQVNQHEKMVVATSMNKAFAGAGSALVFKNYEWARMVGTCSKSIIFSGPIQPPMLGACIASAKIHLSDEIYSLQNALQERIQYIHFLMDKYELPLISSTDSPIFFVGTGTPEVSYNIALRMKHEGYLMNLALFPAVPLKNGGLRFTVHLHQSMDDLRDMVEKLHYHLPISLAEEGQSMEKIKKAFGLNNKVKSKKSQQMQH